MFETSSVNRSKKKFHPLTFLISAVLHIAAIGLVTFATVWDVDMPSKTPKQISTFALAPSVPAPPPPPPPPGDPGANDRQDNPPTIEEPVPVPDPEAAPTEILEIGETLDDLPGTGDVSGDPLGEPGGEHGGVPGGEVGGVGTGEPGGTGVIDNTTYVPGNGVTAPVITRRVEPVYPPLLQRIGKSGTVVIQCVISRSGQLTDIRVIHASHPLFAQAALDAVNQWGFLPGRLDGQPVATRFDFTVNFQVQR